MRVLGKGFQDQQKDHQRKVSAAYRLIDPKQVKEILPGGKAQADAIIRSFAIILQIDLYQQDTKMYMQLLYMFVRIWIRSKKVPETDNQIRDMLLSKYGDCIHDANVDRILMFAQISMKSPRFSLTDPKDAAFLAEMAATTYENRQISRRNEKIADRYIADPEYGLIPTKPIYTDGVIGSYSYLNSLCTDAGEPLRWERLSSSFADGIDGLIDCYELYLKADGKPYGKLYLNLYALSNSKTAPAGYKFITGNPADQ